MLNALLPPGLAAKHAKTERYGMVLVLLLFLLFFFVLAFGLLLCSACARFS